MVRRVKSYEISHLFSVVTGSISPFWRITTNVGKFHAILHHRFRSQLVARAFSERIFQYGDHTVPQVRPSDLLVRRVIGTAHGIFRRIDDEGSRALRLHRSDSVPPAYEAVVAILHHRPLSSGKYGVRGNRSRKKSGERILSPAFSFSRFTDPYRLIDTFERLILSEYPGTIEWGR